MGHAIYDEKIGIRRIRLEQLGTRAIAVAGSFANADNFLMAWCRASRGWLQYSFEIEYLDKSILHGEYRSCRRGDSRISLSFHIRSAFRNCLDSVRSGTDYTQSSAMHEMHFSCGNNCHLIDSDFLEHYDTGDFSGP